LHAILFFTVLGAGPLRGDTVYLKNGNWIDGRVAGENDQSVQLQIGSIGTIDIPKVTVERVETNSRYGAVPRPPAFRERTEAPTGGSTEGGKDLRPRKAAGKSAPGGAESDEVGDRRKTAGVPATGKTAGAKTPKGTEALRKDKGSETDADRAATGDGAGAADSEQKPQAPIDPKLKERIEELVRELTRQKANYRVRAERHLRAVGAPAVPFLLPLSSHEGELVRAAVFRLLAEFGDESVVDSSIEALADGSAAVRDLAHRALLRVTKEDFGYQPQGTFKARQVAQDRWRRWWDEEKKLVNELRGAAGDDADGDPATEHSVATEKEPERKAQPDSRQEPERELEAPQPAVPTPLPKPANP
jgi:hypothetical protein